MPSRSQGHVSYDEWFRAQQPILGTDGQEALRLKTIFIAGAGGLGSNIAVFASRLGFQSIYQCDPQTVEPDNLNRILATARHLGRTKVFAVRELLLFFDRLGRDKDFSYVPLPVAVEREEVRPYLDKAELIISCPNSFSARRFLARYAVECSKPLFNVGFSCSPGNFMGGEVSIYRPNRRDLACPGCIALHQPNAEDRPGDPLFHPPLAILAGLAVHLLVAELTNFDLQADERPNYFLYDGFQHSLSAFRVAPDSECSICQLRQSATSAEVMGLTPTHQEKLK